MKTSVPELPSHFVSRSRLLDVPDERPAAVTLVCAPVAMALYARRK